MKKQILLGTALLAAISVFPQQSVQKVKGESYDMASFLARKFAMQMHAVEAESKPSQSADPQTDPEYGPEMDPALAGRSSAIPAPANWQVISKSMNIYGVL